MVPCLSQMKKKELLLSSEEFQVHFKWQKCLSTCTIPLTTLIHISEETETVASWENQIVWKCIPSYISGKMHPILLLSSPCEITLGKGDSTELSLPSLFLTYTGWPGLPPWPGAVKDNQRTAHSQFSWEGGHQERLAEEQLLRLTIPQVPIKAVQKGISQPVQLALAYLLRNASADL